MFQYVVMTSTTHAQCRMLWWCDMRCVIVECTPRYVALLRLAW
jgi:hypothetical protein